MMKAKDEQSQLSVPHDAMIFVGDGQKALFLRNKGDEKFPNLIAERVFVDDNPLTHEQGTDRPGRVFKRAATNRRSGVAATDWHEVEKHRFARRVAAANAVPMLPPISTGWPAERRAAGRLSCPGPKARVAPLR